MAHVYLSAAHKSSGKTTLSVGLAAAMAGRGLTVQTFKKGPDYIDPLWLGRATGRPCINLDFNTMDPALLRQRFAQWRQGADMALIEGNKGLFDGVAVDGSNSNAALTRLLQAPVIMVLDVQGITRGVAPLLLGYQAFERGLRIAGVVLNKVAGARHEAKLREVIAHYTDLEILGAVPRDSRLAIEERHLGLVPSNELGGADDHIRTIAQLIEEHVDVSRVLEIARLAPEFAAAEAGAVDPVTPDVRIGVPRDRAFGFYYPDDLAALREAGAELVFFDSLSDTGLPPVDGLFIGGGFPETHLPELESNERLRRDIRHFVRQDGPVYAECGGLMYLARQVSWGTRRAALCGALPLDIRMEPRPVGRGYVRLAETGAAPWGRLQEQGRAIAAHEFHYSRVERHDGEAKYAYRVTRGFGMDGRHDGLVHRRVLASYAHLRNMPPVLWAARFIDYVRQTKH